MPAHDPLEVRFHARGGQGAKTAAQILAEAALLEDKYIQAFPQYGPERRGAPVETFVRIGPQPIFIHSQIGHPDFVVVLDPTLTATVDVAFGVNDGLLLFNSNQSLGAIRRLTGFEGRIVILDASRIARFFLGRDIPNLVMIGALARVSDAVGFDGLVAALEEQFAVKWGLKLIQKNILAMKTGYEETVG